MYKRLFLFASLFVSLTVSSQTVSQKLAELMDAYNRFGPFNGNVLIARHDSILFQKSYGFSNIAGTSILDADAQFQIGSVTKQFTATVILQLQEEKKLSVRDKLSKYFPEIKWADSVSIENLLRHTSGIYSYTNSREFMEKEVEKPHSQAEMIALFSNKSLEFTPGTDWRYSNSGYQLLGYIIEKVSGKPYEWNVRNRIFKPLGMNQSGFDFVHLSDAHKATGYFTLNGTSSVKAPVVDSTVAYSAGAIYSSTGDLYKWSQAVSAGKLLKPASWKQAFTPGLRRYGYGWNIDSLHQPMLINHGGGIHGFNSILFTVPANKTCIVLLSNVNTDILDKIAPQVQALLDGKPYTIPAEKKVIELDSLALHEYEGSYELAPTFALRIFVDGNKLMSQATNQGAFEIFPEKKDGFFFKVVKAELEFKRDANGKIDQLILHQNGRDLPGKKIK